MISDLGDVGLMGEAVQGFWGAVQCNREWLWSVEFPRYAQGHAGAGARAVPGTCAGDVGHYRQWVYVLWQGGVQEPGCEG